MTPGLVFPSGVTTARLSLGRAGSGMPTRAVLAFAVDHARARDAVHAGLATAPLVAAIAALGLEPIEVASAAPDRPTYLRRPDFGRRLSRTSREALAGRPSAPADLVVVIADGLSATAVSTNAIPVLERILAAARAGGLTIGPVVIATQARVAIGDEIGELLGARLAVVLIGERPGLSAADSLGAYLTAAPRLGRRDSERNCVSNIRSAGLSAEAAAHTIVWLAARALRGDGTGVALKDESGSAALAAPGAALPRWNP